MAAATGVGYTTAHNPSAGPGASAVILRVLIILTLTAAGLYAQTSRLQARMGRLLIGAAAFAVLWLLNGSANRVLFTVGAATAGLAQAVFAYLMLAHPVGRVESRAARRFLLYTAIPMWALWLLALEATGQPAFKTPLLQCAPHCPENPLALGSATSAGEPLRVLLAMTWLVIVSGTAIMLLRRISSASALARHALTPVWMMAMISAFLTVAYLVVLTAGSGARETIGAVDVGIAAAVPVAILLGLVVERLFVGQALADFVSELSTTPNADPEALMGKALRDPMLRVAYARIDQNGYVDATGTTVPLDSHRALARVERAGHPVAAVAYDPELAGQERFVKAAAAAALMRLEQARLQADLKASNAELNASRSRLVHTAEEERRRIERDLHDGVQQQLLGLRMKLDVAAETVKEDPDRGRATLAVVGRQMDDVLIELRSLARGIYPSLLHDRGLAEALRSAVRASPTPAVLKAGRLGRYREDVEAAVYYCCLEALQNVTKHAGAEATAILTLSQEGSRLCFGVSDTGHGFDAARTPSGAGLINMRDRIQTVGGTVEITSWPGRGTSVRGSVPVTATGP